MSQDKLKHMTYYKKDSTSIYSDDERKLFNAYKQTQKEKPKEYLWSVACHMTDGTASSVVLITKWAQTKDEAHGHAVSEALESKPHMFVANVISLYTASRTL